DEEIDPGCVATWPREASDQTKFDRIIADAKNDWDRRRCSLDRQRRRCTARRGDHGHATAHHFGRQRWQLIVLTFRPTILDRHVLTFDIASLSEAFAESRRVLSGANG